MKKKVLSEQLIQKINKAVKSSLLESLGTSDVKIYAIYDDYTQTFTVFTSATPGIDDILANADNVEEYDSMQDLKRNVDYNYESVYERWGDEYNKITKYYILYNDYREQFIFQTIEGLKYLGYDRYPVVYQSNDLDEIMSVYDKL